MFQRRTTHPGVRGDKVKRIMSKNFIELMQLDHEPAIPPEVSLRSNNGDGPAHGNGARLDLACLAREEFLKLVQRVFLSRSIDRPHVVMFAAVDQGNGCSRTCIGIADTLAHNVSGSVCLIDANMRAPSLPRYLSVTNHRGLTQALLEEGPVRSFAKQIRPGNLWLLSSGSLCSDSSSLLKSARLGARLSELRSEFDYVLIDVPPLNQYADAIGLGQLTDGVVLILEANSTRRESAKKVTESLRASNVPILGAVLNRRTYPIPQTFYQRL
jgi:capsular exopolysaccharide synthesis family protein